MKTQRLLLVVFMALTVISAYAREEIIQAPELFVAEALEGHTPPPGIVWLTKEIASGAHKILGHAPAQLRQRYWADHGKTVWVLEEIGKEEPITAGFVVEGGRILYARVLVYRESRGGEIRYSAFLKQYEGIRLTSDDRLDRPVDGISGATLSVQAMGRMARFALYLDKVAKGISP